jgi:hypothetical protein
MNKIALGAAALLAVSVNAAAAVSTDPSAIASLLYPHCQAFLNDAPSDWFNKTGARSYQLALSLFLCSGQKTKRDVLLQLVHPRRRGCHRFEHQFPRRAILPVRPMDQN